MKKSFLKQTVPKNPEVGKQLDLTITGFSNLNLEPVSKNVIKNENEPLKQSKLLKKDRNNNKQVSFQDFGQISSKNIIPSKLNDDMLINKQKSINRHIPT